MSKLVGKYLIILSLVYAGASAAEDEPNIGYCSNCSSAGFAWAAEQAAPPTGGMHPVYVIDTIFGEVRYFNVSVWWDCGGNELQSVDDGVQSLDEGGMDSSTLSSCTQKEAIQGVGDALIISEMMNAHFAVIDFLEKFRIDSGELPNSGDSAIDMVGPNEAGLARMNLQNAVANHLQSFWGTLIFSMADTATRIANRFIGNSNYVSPASLVTVTFPDGTSIKLDVVRISSFIDGTVTVLVEVLTETLQLPDGRAVPQLEDQFPGFNYAGDENIVESIIELAHRFGIPVTGAGGPRIACVRVDGGAIICHRLT